MNLKSVKKLAFRNMPQVPVHVIKDALRQDVVAPLNGSNNVGIELGVATGVFSERMMKSGKFGSFYGVDIYGDTHDTEEYKSALKRIGITENYKLLRMSFEDALDLFEDDFFDFIYIDGFAHTGEEGGKTIGNWYRKLKVGGVIAGDDYHEDWPLVMWAVNHFVLQLEASLKITAKTDDEAYCNYPSWFVVKQNDKINLQTSDTLKKVAMSEQQRIHRKRIFNLKIIRILEFLGIRKTVRKLLGRN